LASRQGRQQDYGQRWGEGAARCFSLEGDFLDETQGPRLMPVPDSFFCPISSAIMVDPVATVDGCAYEREYIERWFRERRQMRQMITSPMTGLELPSTTLMPLLALQRAIEAYLVCRPEIRKGHMAARSFEEAACVLQVDLLEKEAITASTHEELRRMREAHRSLQRELRRSEGTCASLNEELRRTREWARTLEDEKGAALQAGIDARRDAAPCSSTAPSLVGDNATDIATSADEAPSSLRAAARPGALVHRQPLEGGVPRRPAFLGTPAAPLIRRGPWRGRRRRGGGGGSRIRWRRLWCGRCFHEAEMALIAVHERPPRCDCCLAGIGGGGLAASFAVLADRGAREQLGRFVSGLWRHLLAFVPGRHLLAIAPGCHYLVHSPHVAARPRSCRGSLAGCELDDRRRRQRQTTREGGGKQLEREAGDSWRGRLGASRERCSCWRSSSRARRRCRARRPQQQRHGGFASLLAHAGARKSGSRGLRRLRAAEEASGSAPAIGYHRCGWHPRRRCESRAVFGGAPARANSGCTWWP